MRLTLASLSLLAALVGPGAAQFTGPSAGGDMMTVEAAHEARLGTYAALTGRIVEHLREDYYLFEDDTGSIRVEIEPVRWGGRSVGPETRVRLVGEIDPYPADGRYLWVRSLDVLE